MILGLEGSRYALVESFRGVETDVAAEYFPFLAYISPKKKQKSEKGSRKYKKHSLYIYVLSVP